MQNFVYDLSCINDVINNINSNNNSNNSNNNDECIRTIHTKDNFNLIHKQWLKNDKVYNIIKYDKSFLTYDMVDQLGIYRSLVTSNDKVMVFSPPKSLNITIFMNNYKEEQCISEEFIEGTMINLFYDNDINKWEIASKSTVGGNIAFYKDSPTFAELFYEICAELNVNFDNYSKEYCYSFVMQHPNNKFVIPIIEKRLYMIAIYKIDNVLHNVTEISKIDYLNEVGNQENLGRIMLPRVYRFNTYSELIDMYGSMNTPTNIMGIIIRSVDGHRTKIRNPNYEYVKHLRGNNTKMQYQYLCLRKLGQVKDYLGYFPQNRTQFSVFKKQVHLFTDNLYANYINCYIKKEKSLKEFPIQFRNHMYNLHKHYLSIRELRGYINKSVVVNYINNLESSRLMYSMNYHLRGLVKPSQKDTTNTTEEPCEMETIIS